MTEVARSSETLPFPLLACVCLASPHQDDVGCVCLREERFLRHVIAGKQHLNPEQREWCKAEILKIEGYSEIDTAHDDVELCRTVLAAWTDYCRDKGLL